MKRKIRLTQYNLLTLHNEMDKKSNILLEILSTEKAGQVDKQYAETINFYRECSELIEKTYFALGRKKEYNFTTQSTTNGKIDTRTISETSKI
jgi:hypothetical protein